MTWELRLDHTTSHGYFWVGTAEKATFEFTAPPEWLPFVEEWIERAAGELAEALLRYRGRLLRLRLYFEPGEWWHSRWLVECWAYGSPLPWSLIIPLFLVLLIGIVVGWVLLEVKEEPWLGLATLGLMSVIAAGVGYTAYRLTR